jgi:hypothetical protein
MMTSDNIVFIKTKNKKYVDGDVIDKAIYLYDGPFSYRTIMGVKKTIYSFKEINTDHYYFLFNF